MTHGKKLPSGRGYHGEVTLVHVNTGAVMTIKLKGRREIGASGELVTPDTPSQRRLKKLLARGWALPSGDNTPEKKQVGKKGSEPKPQGKEQGSKPMPNGKDPGDTSGDKGKKPRGARGGKGRGKKGQGRGESPQKTLQVFTKPIGGSPVYAPQEPYVDSETIESTEKSARLLAQIIGHRSSSRTNKDRIRRIDVPGLLRALELDMNPIPYLERPQNKRIKPPVRVLVTHDWSGSCQDFSAVTSGWSHHLSLQSGLEIVSVENFNGEINQDLPFEGFDIVIYLGDADGTEMCQKAARAGATVIAFDCYGSSMASKPYMTRADNMHKKGLFWIKGISRKRPLDWVEALTLVISKNQK